MPNKGKRIRSKRVNPAKKNSTSFKEGNTTARKGGAPKGLAQYDAEELASRTIDKRMVTRYLTLNSHLTKDQLRAKLNNGQCSILEAMIVRGMLSAYYTGDVYKIDFFLDRLIGKVPNKVEHTKADPYEGKSLEELMELKKELAEHNLKTLRFIEQSERVKQQEREVIEITANASAPNPSGDNQGT